MTTKKVVTIEFENWLELPLVYGKAIEKYEAGEAEGDNEEEYYYDRGYGSISIILLRVESKSSYSVYPYKAFFEIVGI